jgi:hypothetical protein
MSLTQSTTFHRFKLKLPSWALKFLLSDVPRNQSAEFQKNINADETKIRELLIDVLSTAKFTWSILIGS